MHEPPLLAKRYGLGGNRSMSANKSQHDSILSTTEHAYFCPSGSRSVVIQRVRMRAIAFDWRYCLCKCYSSWSHPESGFLALASILLG